MRDPRERRPPDSMPCSPNARIGRNFASGTLRRQPSSSAMNETLKQIGMELKRFFSGEVRRPLNWRMIDAIETLRKAEAKEDETNAEIERGSRLEDDQSNVTDIALPSDSGKRT